MTSPASTFPPPPPTTDAEVADRIAGAYGIRLGQRVEVDLLVTAQGGPKGIAGATIVDATPGVLVVEHAGGQVTSRIPWHAIAVIRTNDHHPAHQ